MTDDRYELFISYSRKDDTGGWVTALRDAILADHRRFSSEPMRIFFDRDAIADMDDWRHRILRGLRASSLLLVCLSPNYFESPYCRWEFDEYMRTLARVQVGGEGIAPVYFVELPDADPAVDARWRAEVAERHNFTDLREWFPLGVGAIEDAEVAVRLAKLGEQVWDRLGRVRRAESVRGNVRRPSPTFVGRHRETHRLHSELTTGQSGVVTTLHGLGGMGKTELAVAYAHAFRDHYRGGAWSLSAAGKSDLLALVGELAFAPELGFHPNQDERMDPHRLGRAVLAHLVGLASEDPSDEVWGDSGRAALLILDNVDDPALLSARQVADLPASDLLRVVATTRMSDMQFTAPTSLAFIPVDGLDPADALELLRAHQPTRDDDGLIPDFADGAQQAAAEEIVDRLDGYTLATEQVAVYLGLNPQVTPAALLSGLTAKGVGLSDEVADDNVRAAMQHQSGLLEQVLESSLGLLDEPGRYALLLAANMPPDSVPWSWLSELTIARFPELAEHAEWEPNPWGDVRRHIEGLRLLTPADRPEIARIHRVIAAQIRGHDAASTIAAQDGIDQYLGEWAARSETVWRSDLRYPSDWELDVALASLPDALGRPDGAAVASLFLGVADVVLDARGPAVAMDSFGAIHRMIQGRFDADPDNRDFLGDLAGIRDAMGAIPERTGERAAARAEYEGALAIYRQLADADPANADLQLSVAALLIRAFGTASAADRCEGEAALQDARSILRSLVAADPTDEELQRYLAQAILDCGEYAGERGDRVAQRDAYRESLTILTRLCDSGRSSGPLIAQMIHTVNNLALTQASWGEGSVAEETIEVALGTIREMTAEDPEDTLAQGLLQVSLDSAGQIANARGDKSGALEAYHERIAVIRGLANADASNLGLQRELAGALITSGRAAVDAGHPDTAPAALKEGIGLLRKLADAAPADFTSQRELADALLEYGKAAVDAGHPEAAQESLTESVRILRGLAEADPTNMRRQMELASALLACGSARMVSGNLDAATALLHESMSLFRRSAAQDPSHTETQRGLALALDTFGALTQLAGNGSAGYELQCEALSIFRRIAAEDPDNPAGQEDITRSLKNGAGLIETLNGRRSKEARAAWTELAAHLELLSGLGELNSADQELKSLARSRTKAAGWRRPFTK